MLLLAALPEPDDVALHGDDSMAGLMSREPQAESAESCWCCMKAAPMAAACAMAAYSLVADEDAAVVAVVSESGVASFGGVGGKVKRWWW